MFSVAGTSSWKKHLRIRKELLRPLWPNCTRRGISYSFPHLRCKIGKAQKYRCTADETCAFQVCYCSGQFSPLFYIIPYNTRDVIKCEHLLVIYRLFSLSSRYRLKEASETHKKVEHEIKIAVFTLINEINKKGKSLLQQLEVWGECWCGNVKTTDFSVFLLWIIARLLELLCSN